MYYVISVLIINIIAIVVTGKLTKKFKIKLNEDDKIGILIGLTVASIIWPISLSILTLVGLFIGVVGVASWLFDKAQN